MSTFGNNPEINIRANIDWSDAERHSEDVARRIRNSMSATFFSEGKMGSGVVTSSSASGGYGYRVQPSYGVAGPGGVDQLSRESERIARALGNVATSLERFARPGQQGGFMTMSVGGGQPFHSPAKTGLPDDPRIKPMGLAETEVYTRPKVHDPFAVGGRRPFHAPYEFAEGPKPMGLEPGEVLPPNALAARNRSNWQRQARSMREYNRQMQAIEEAGRYAPTEYGPQLPGIQSDREAYERYKQVTSPEGEGGSGPRFRLFRGSTWGKLSPFYQRFIALEGIRAAANVGYAFRQRSIGESTALGDANLKAEANLQFYKDVASGMPFGIGKIAEMAIDPTGSKEAGIRTSLASAQIGEQVALAQHNRMEATLQSRESLGVQTARPGMERTIQQALAESQKTQRAIRDEGGQSQALLSKRHQANLSIFNDQATWDWTPSWSGNEYSFTGRATRQRNANIAGENTAYARQVQKNTSQTNELLGNERLRADREVQEISRGVGREILGLSASEANFREQASMGIMTGADFQNRNMVLARFVTQQSIARNAMIRRQKMDMENAKPELREGLQSNQQAELAAFDREQAESKGVEEYNLKIQGQVIAQRLNTNIAVSVAKLSRMPLQARLSQIQGQLKEALLTADPADRQALKLNAEQEEKVARQEYNDNRYLDTMDMSRRVAVTGLLSQAYGPGAAMFRRRAQVEDIKGSAEEAAQARLLRDSTDTANANRERQVGINRLGMMRAEYLESFSVRQGSANLMNLSRPDSIANSPQQVFADIKKGIDDLNRNMKNLVAGE